jgi:hypothetical protein
LPWPLRLFGKGILFGLAGSKVQPNSAYTPQVK